MTIIKEVKSMESNEVKLQEFLIETQFKADETLALNKGREIVTTVSVSPTGSHPAAHSPVETIIGALGACFLINLQRYFNEKQKKLTDSDVHMELKGYRDPSIPKLVKITYVVEINDKFEFDPETLKEFMEKQSTTYRTLENCVEISGEIKKFSN